MKSKLSIIIIALAAAVLSLGAFAGSGDGMRSDCTPHYGEGKGPRIVHFGHGDPERRLMHMTKKLDLTESQQEEVKGILESAKSKAEPLKEKMRKNMKAEHMAMSENASERELKSLARKSADSRVDMMLHMRGVRKEIRGVLTDEQRVKMDEMEARRKAHMKKRMEKYKEQTTAE